MTPVQFAACTGSTLSRAVAWAPLFDVAMPAWGIDTPARQAAFLAEVGHESAGLKWTAEIWGDTPAQLRYEGRTDLGNTQPGDGKRFKGRGPIQITGRANYRRYGAVLGLDLENHPELLEVPAHGVRAACAFWQGNDLNKWADKGDFDGVSDVINRGHKTAAEGDSNGYANRLALYQQAKAVLA